MSVPKLCEKCSKRRVDLFYAMVTVELDFSEICLCDVTPEFVETASSVPVAVCKRCAKRMQDKDSGSTQWIFRHSYCNCEVPDRFPIDSEMMEEMVQQLVDQKRKRKERLAKDEPEMQVDERKFPYESFKPLKHIESTSGRVFKCRDRQLGSLVVLKILKTQNLQPHQLLQLQKEAKSVAELDHESILKVLDFGVLRETYPFLVTEYVESETLRSVMDNSDRLQIYTTVQVIAQVCEAISHAHSRGIFHWNLAADKILLINPTDVDPIVKVSDFGFALNAVTYGTFESEQGLSLVGTTGYMSPEQATGQEYDPRSEVYSIGCILFEMLTGGLPYRGQSLPEIISQQTSRPVPKLRDMSRRHDFPEELEKIVAKCLQPNKDDRYSTVAQLKRAINSFARRPTVVPEALPEPIWRTALEEHRIVIVIVLIGLLLGSVWGTYMWLMSESAYNALGKSGMQSFLVTLGNDNAKVQQAREILDSNLKDKSKAATLFREAAAHGSAQAEFWLGYCYLKGIARLTQHGEGGYAGAFTSVSQANETELKNYAEGYALISRAAEKGYPAAERYKGLLIRIGMDRTGEIKATSKGRLQRLEDSATWLKKAAAHGDPQAINYLGIEKAVEFGWSPQSYVGAFDYSDKRKAEKEEVFELFREAAEAGQPDAQFNMGLCYELGVGTPPNNEAAKKAYLAAAKSGVSDAQFRYGFLLEQEKSPDAVKWYKQAAAQNNLYAMIALCRCYSEGFCIPANRIQAQYWYRAVVEHPERLYVPKPLFTDSVNLLSLEKVVAGMDRVCKEHLEQPHLVVQRWGPSGMKCWPRGPVRDVDLMQLSTMKDVQYLDLYGMSMHDRGSEYLPNLPLTMLRLSGQDLSPSGYGNIAKLRSLKGLELSGDVRTDGLSKLSECRGLVFVGVTGLISQETIDQLSALKSLKSVAFHCRKDVSFAKWGNLPNLEGLGLDEVTQKTINSLAAMKNLRALTIVSFKQSGGSTDTLDLAPLTTLPKLERLRLKQTFNAHVVAQLKSFTHLQSLSITSAKGIADEDLHLLAEIPAKDIEIYLDADCKITDKGLMILGSIPSVTHVNISASPVTPGGLKAFKEKFPNHLVSYSAKSKKGKRRGADEEDQVQEQVEKQITKQLKEQAKEKAKNPAKFQPKEEEIED